MSDLLTAIDAGLAQADPGREQEAADVKRWFKRIEQARKFDEEARKQYAKDRRYARGDSGFDVDANIAGTNIDILESFLYAKNPDVAITPAPRALPPSDAEILAAASRLAKQDPAAALVPPEALDMIVQAKAAEMREQFQQQLADVKALAGTSEVIVSQLWGDAGLKRRGRTWVRSALTVGVGILKASWQERTAPSPETAQAINDLQRDIARLKAMEEDLAEEADNEALLAQYQRELARLQQQPEPVVSRGFAVDVVQPENWQVSPGVMLGDFLDAPWIAERIPMRLEDARADFGLSAKQAKKATIYKARKPEMGRNETPALTEDLSATDADSYVTTATPNASIDGESDDYVMVWEIWDRGGGCVLTGIEGCPFWVKPPWTPTATERFFPYFGVFISFVDGQRHPQSLIARTAKLLDEYNRIGSAERDHRKRVMPQILFDSEQVDTTTADKLTGGVAAEFVGVKTTSNGKIGDTFMEKPYPRIDPALYDRNRIISEIERQWGVQEALSGAVNVAKTATEAEIQQTGFQARTGGRRDAVEGALGELAQYTVEVARAHVTLEDAQQIAGPNAFWPQYAGADDLQSLVSVDILAGSSGKPNTTAEREAWAMTLPMLQQGVMQIGQLRNSAPEDLADSLAELLRITVERSGDRIDVDQLLPKVGPAPVPMPGQMPGQEQPMPVEGA